MESIRCLWSACEFREREHIGVGQVISAILHAPAAIEDDNVSRRQIDTRTASANHKQGDAFVGVGPVIFVEVGDTIFVRSATFDETTSCSNTQESVDDQ
jgi:hypothetical protein